MNKKPAKLRPPPSLGAILKANGKNWHNDFRDGYAPVLTQLGQPYDAPSLWPSLIVSDEELDSNIDDCLDPYMCVMCRGTGIGLIAKKLRGASDTTLNEDFDVYFDCSACAGKGKPPISWKDLM